MLSSCLTFQDAGLPVWEKFNFNMVECFLLIYKVSKKGEYCVFVSFINERV